VKIIAVIIEIVCVCAKLYTEESTRKVI